MAWSRYISHEPFCSMLTSFYLFVLKLQFFKPWYQQSRGILKSYSMLCKEAGMAFSRLPG